MWLSILFRNLGSRPTMRTKPLVMCHQQILSISCRKEYDGHIEQLRKLLDCSYEEGSYIITKWKTFLRVEPMRLEKAKDMLQRFGVTKKGIIEHPDILTIHPATIEHHFMLLEEGGFEKINVPILLSYLPIIKKRISLIKAYGHIAAGTNVAERFLSHLECPPPHVQPFPPTTDDSATFCSVYVGVLKHYLTWRLEMAPGDIDGIIKTYRRINHRSLRHMRRTLSILEDELGFSKEKIRKNGYLIHSHPDNTMDTLTNVKTLGGLDIKTVVTKYPKIIMTTTDTLIKTSRYLQEFGISDSSVQRCLDVFTLGSESVRQRLQQLEQVPEFRALVSHPRVLRLVHYQHKAQSRLEYLQEQRVRCASLNILSAPRALFEKYARDGEDRTRGVDVTCYLADVLGGTPREMRHEMQRHPFWRNVPLVTIRSTLDLLLAQGFSSKSIISNVHILLYPRDRVEQELELLSQREEVAAAQQLCAQSTGTDPPPALTMDIRLALCLYFMERVHHFTGDGIWTTHGSGDGEPTVVDSSMPLPRDGRAFRLSETRAKKQ